LVSKKTEDDFCKTFFVLWEKMENFDINFNFGLKFSAKLKVFFWLSFELYFPVTALKKVFPVGFCESDNRMFFFILYVCWTKMIQSRRINRYANFSKKNVTIFKIIQFSSVFSWQFSKISQKIAKVNDLHC